MAVEDPAEDGGGVGEVWDDEVTAGVAEFGGGGAASGDGEGAAAVGEGGVDVVGRVADDDDVGGCESRGAEGLVAADSDGDEVGPVWRVVGGVITPDTDLERGEGDAAALELHGAGGLEVAREDAESERG